MSIWDTVNAGFEQGDRMGRRLRNQRAYSDGGLTGVEEAAGGAGDLETMEYARGMQRRARQDQRDERTFQDDTTQRAYQRMETIAPWARNVIRASRNMDPARARAFLEQNSQRFLDFGFTPEQLRAGIDGLTSEDQETREQWATQLDGAFTQHQDPTWNVSEVTGQLYAANPDGTVQTGADVPGAEQIRQATQLDLRTRERAANAPYSTARERSTYTLLTPQEVQAEGLPPGSYQRNDDTGQISVVGRTRGQYTDSAAASAQFAARMTAADQTLLTLEAGNTNPAGVYIARAGFGGQEERRVRQAQREFVNAVLRKESGAVISPEEFASAAQQYFPQPGDGPTVIAQKRAARQRAIRGLINASQGAYDEWYGEGSGAETPPPGEGAGQQQDPLGIR